MIVLLDAYHLGDPLFLTGFTRDVARYDQPAPLILVHGAGEAAERALEASGQDVARVGGVLAVRSEQEAATVERAARELGREITHALNEAGVAAVRFTGADRGLLRQGTDGVKANAGWLLALARQGAVPVVTALAAGGGEGALREVPAAAAAVALARATGLPVGLLGGRDAREEGRLAARMADRDGVEVVENARSGWNRGAGLGG